MYAKIFSLLVLMLYTLLSAIMVMLGFERSEFAEHPGWYIRFNDKDVIFLDPRGSSMRSSSRMTLRAEALKTLFNTSLLPFIVILGRHTQQDVPVPRIRESHCGSNVHINLVTCGRGRRLVCG